VRIYKEIIGFWEAWIEQNPDREALLGVYQAKERRKNGENCCLGAKARRKIRTK
jgi:hypothetical protein